MGHSNASRLRAVPTLTGGAPALDLAALPPDPVALFWEWFDDALAADVPEAVAATLATVDVDGLPDARVLILKDVDERGWAVAGPASSGKGVQLAANPVAALSLWWQPMARAIRVRGRVVEASAEESAADLAARSPAARATVAPGDWRLWRIVPSRVEFWQGSPDRRHLRIIDTRVEGGPWVREIREGEAGQTLASSPDTVSSDPGTMR